MITMKNAKIKLMLRIIGVILLVVLLGALGVLERGYYWPAAAELMVLPLGIGCSIGAYLKEVRNER